MLISGRCRYWRHADIIVHPWSNGKHYYTNKSGKSIDQLLKCFTGKVKEMSRDKQSLGTTNVFTKCHGVAVLQSGPKLWMNRGTKSQKTLPSVEPHCASLVHQIRQLTTEEKHRNERTTDDTLYLLKKLQPSGNHQITQLRDVAHTYDSNSAPFISSVVLSSHIPISHQTAMCWLTCCRVRCQD